MLAEVINGIRAASLPSVQRPKLSPMSQLISIARAMAQLLSRFSSLMAVSCPASRSIASSSETSLKWM